MNLPIKTILIVMTFVFSCKSVNEYNSNKLKSFIEENHFNYNELRAVFVLTEKGCPSCNRYFSQFIQKQLSNKELLCVISAKGNVLDLSLFKEEDVLMDYNLVFKDLGITKETSTILLNENGSIDTVIKIKSDRLEPTLEYLSKQLNL